MANVNNSVITTIFVTVNTLLKLGKNCKFLCLASSDAQLMARIVENVMRMIVHMM